jgi:hypothetical protein
MAEHLSRRAFWLRVFVFLFWTVVATASVLTAISRWGDRAAEGLYILGFYFWPTIIALVVSSWPGMTRGRHLRVCCVVGVVLLAANWVYGWATNDLGLWPLEMNIGLIAWTPQVAIVGVVYLAYLFVMDGW